MAPRKAVWHHRPYGPARAFLQVFNLMNGKRTLPETRVREPCPRHTPGVTDVPSARLVEGPAWCHRPTGRPPAVLSTGDPEAHFAKRKKPEAGPRGRGSHDSVPVMLQGGRQAGDCAGPAGARGSLTETGRGCSGGCNDPGPGDTRPQESAARRTGLHSRVNWKVCELKINQPGDGKPQDGTQWCPQPLTGSRMRTRPPCGGGRGGSDPGNHRNGHRRLDPAAHPDHGR